jgi:hypothetical protein
MLHNSLISHGKSLKNIKKKKKSTPIKAYKQKQILSKKGFDFRR